MLGYAYAHVHFLITSQLDAGACRRHLSLLRRLLSRCSFFFFFFAVDYSASHIGVSYKLLRAYVTSSLGSVANTYLLERGVDVLL